MQISVNAPSLWKSLPPPDSMSATKIQSLPPSLGPPGTTFKLGYGYTPLSSTAVITYLSPAKISIPIQITYMLYMVDPFPPDLWGYVHRFGHHPEGLVAPLDTTTYWSYGKSLYARPYEISYMDLAIIMTFFTCCCWSTTTRKGRMYKMYEEVWDRWKQRTSVSVTFDAFGWLDLQQNQHLRPSSYNFLWRVRTSGCQQYTISYQRYNEDDLGEGLPVIDDTSTMTTWVKDY